jgi:hypothetical protein
MEVLRIVQLHIDPDMLWKATSKQLSLLQRRQPARVRHARLERLHICIHSRGERKSRQVCQVVGG